MPRKMAARTIKKMQVPAYCPMVLGDHASEYRGVLIEEKKTIIMSPIDIIPLELMSIPDMPDMPGMEESEVDEGIMLPEVMVMVMPLMLLMSDMAVDVAIFMPLMLDISITAIVDPVPSPSRQQRVPS